MRDVEQRCGDSARKPRGAATPLFPRRQDLRTPAVVVHDGGIFVRVQEHDTSRIHDRESNVRDPPDLLETIPEPAFRPGGEDSASQVAQQFCLHVQPRFDLRACVLGEAPRHPHTDDGEGHERHHGIGAKQLPEEPRGHPLPPPIPEPISDAAHGLDLFTM